MFEYYLQALKIVKVSIAQDRKSLYQLALIKQNDMKKLIQS